MFSAILASIGYAGGVVVDKIILSLNRISTRIFIPLLFAFLAGITLIFVPFLGKLDFSKLTLWYAALFIAMLVVAVIWNIYYYEGLQKENLHEFELIMLFSPIATIIFAEAFLPSERNLGVFIAGLVASAAFLFSRLKSHHLAISKTAKGTILAMVLISFESVLIRLLLDVFSPVILYFLRTLVITAVFYIMYKPKLSTVPAKMIWATALSASFGVLQMVLKYYGFKSLGVIETTMILLLGPFLVYTFSYFYFQERFHYKKDIYCAIVVVLCILYTTLIK